MGGTTLAAIWGAVTGTASLVWNIYKDKKEGPHLLIELSDRNKSFICPPSLVEARGWRFDEPVYVINLLIENNGNKQESITNIKYFDEKYKQWIPTRLDKFSIRDISYPANSAGVFIQHSFPVGKNINLPFIVKAHEAQECEMFIPIISKYQDGAKVRFETTTRLYTKHFYIPRIDQIVPDYQKYNVK